LAAADYRQRGQTEPKLIDLARDIGDTSGSPVVFVGTRHFRQMLLAPANGLMDAVRSRICADLDLPGPSIQDGYLLAKELMEVDAENRLVAHIYQRAGASVRSLLAGLRRVEEVAMTAGLSQITLAEFLSLTGEKLESRKALGEIASKTDRSERAIKEGAKVA
jgi:hypothetical protein